MIIDYAISDVAPYINWDYFFYAWAMHNKPDAEKQRLRDEAQQTLDDLQGRYAAHAVFELYDAHSDGDDIVAGNYRLPMLRQQRADSQFLSLADFVHPQHDRIGVFATTVDRRLETDFAADDYQRMMVQLLADRLAEAAAERMHQEVRQRYWGYAPDEQLSMQQLHAEQFQGIRPAVGYPSLPDTSLNFLIDEMLHLSRIGIRLTEHGAMQPHASVSGLMISCPQARYFTLGKIGSDQLSDYARRRGLPVEVIRKFLSSNL